MKIADKVGIKLAIKTKGTTKNIWEKKKYNIKHIKLNKNGNTLGFNIIVSNIKRYNFFNGKRL